MKMKATGIVRRIDELGRVIIPKEIRRMLHINEGNPLEIYLTEDGNGVIFQKYRPLGIDPTITKIADAMASSAGLSPIAVYDMDCRISGHAPFPEVVPAEWEDCRMSKKVNGFGVYTILHEGDCYGYVVCRENDMGAEIQMIRRYLSAILRD